MHACLCYTVCMKSEADIRKTLSTLTQEQLINMYVDLDYRFNSLQANYDQLRRKYYGVKNHDSVVKGQLSLFNEAEETVDNATPEEQKEPSGKEVVPPKKPKSPRNAKLKNVRVVEEHIRPESTLCPNCGKGMAELKPTTIEYRNYSVALQSPIVDIAAQNFRSVNNTDTAFPRNA